MTIPMTLISLDIVNVDFCETIFVHNITDYNLWFEPQSLMVPYLEM